MFGQVFQRESGHPQFAGHLLPRTGWYGIHQTQPLPRAAARRHDDFRFDLAPVETALECFTARHHGCRPCASDPPLQAQLAAEGAGAGAQQQSIAPGLQQQRLLQPGIRHTPAKELHMGDPCISLARSLKLQQHTRHAPAAPAICATSASNAA